MESPEVQNIEETAQNTDPEMINPEEPQVILNAARVSALDAILKSLLQIRFFTKEGFTEDESVAQLRDFFVNNLNLTDPMEPNGASDLFVFIMELLPRWSNEHGKDKEPLSSLFEMYESATKTCNRCKTDNKSPAERSYGVIMIANTLRKIKYAFKEFTFENVLKTSKITLKMPCDKEGCGKDNYVLRMIEKLPSVFTIALEWEYNEPEEEIRDTISVLATEINIKGIYKHEGGSLFTKYQLVSMVCLCGDSYSGVAFENKKWVRYIGSEKEVIGDWNTFVRSKYVRPVILFFEKAVWSGEIVFGSLGQKI